MKHPRFEDVFSIENDNISIAMLGFWDLKTGFLKSRWVTLSMKI